MSDNNTEQQAEDRSTMRKLSITVMAFMGLTVFLILLANFLT